MVGPPNSVAPLPDLDDSLLLEENLCVDTVDGVANAANAANASGSEEDICVLTTRKVKKQQRFTGSYFNKLTK